MPLILCMLKERLPETWREGGLHPCHHAEFHASIDDDDVWLGPRAWLEADERFVQLIPYTLVTCNGQVIAYRRSSAGSEGRLRGRLSIGFGGHVDLPDLITKDNDGVDLEATLWRACEREIEEELGAVDIAARSVVGVLFDTRTAVGRVHFGVLVHMELERLPDMLASSDAAIEQLETHGLESLMAHEAEMEEWSRMALGWLSSALIQRV